MTEPQRHASYDELLQLMSSRRSIRDFSPAPLPEGTLAQLIEAARAAPSASNRQAYRFVAITSAKRIAAMVAAVRVAVARAAEELPPGRGATFEHYAASFTRFAGAPLVLAPIYRITSESALLARASTAASTRTEARAENAASASDNARAEDTAPSVAVVSSVASVAAATMSLLLAAHALGLGACWMTGPLLAADTLGELLEIPPSWHLSALIPIGYPAETPNPPKRRDVATLLRQLV